MKSKNLSREFKIGYIKDIWQREENFKGTQKFRQIREKRFLFILKINYFNLIAFGICGFYDFIRVLMKLSYISLTNGDKVKLLFLTKNFCVDNHGKLKIRIAPNLFDRNTFIINSSKENYIKKVEGNKVYNIGFFVGLISKLRIFSEDYVLKQFSSYEFVNDYLLKFRNAIESVNFFWFYDLNSFSLIFSKYRDHHKLVEIQHGSIIDYPPYQFPAPAKIADLFYVRNERTVAFLKNHLCKDFHCEFEIIPYFKIVRRYVPGINMLYASTIEFEGFHTVFKDFLKSSHFAASSLNLIIRLHPRERGRESLFLIDLVGFKGRYEFDYSENWLVANAIEGLIVVSPWSSIIEEACDNKFNTITIDEIGKNRFSYLHGNPYFRFSSDLTNSISAII